MGRAILTEDSEMNLLPICKAIEEASGQRVSPPTATRWAIKGCGGVILHSVLLGKKRLCTVDWVNEFIAARSQPQPNGLPEASATRKELEKMLRK